MGARIDDSKRAQYALYRYQMAMPRLRAAKMAGVSNAWAVGFDRELEDDPLELERLLDAHPNGDGSIRDPIPFDELTPLAKALLDDFEQWRVKVMGRTCRPWAVQAAHDIQERFESEDREFIVLSAPPGTGKSTLLADIGLWLTCKHRDLRGVAGSIKSGLSERYTRRLRTEFERDTPLKAGSTAKDKRGALDAEFTMSQLYGRFRPLKPLVWRADGFIVECEDMASRTEKEFTWLAASMEEDFIGDRVNLQLWDDPASKASSRSPEIRHRHFEQWGIIEDRLEPGGLLVLSMQRLAINDLSRHALDKRVTLELDLPDGDVEFEERQKYHHIAFRAHDEEKCKGVHGRTAPAWPDGCLLDPTGLPWRDLQGKMSNRAEYLLTYQQDDSADPDATFKRIWIDGGREADTGILWHGCWDHQRDPGTPVRFERFLSYASVDPSASGFWIVQAWVYDRVSEQRVLIDMHRERMGANDLLDFDIETQQYRGVMEDWQKRSVEWGMRIRFWVLEHNSQQRWLSQYDWARRWYQTRGVVVIGHQTYAHTKLDDKLGPEGSLPSLLQAGKVRLPGSPNGRLVMRPLVDELVHWGSHPTNDCVMAMWMAEFNLSTMLKQPDKDDWDPPVAWRPSWVKRAGRVGQGKRADMLMARLAGYSDR